MSAQTKGSSGFSLIEILIVVGMIGIMVSVILVNITSIRERAADAKKIQKLEQFMFALRMYYNDNKEYPRATPGYSNLTRAKSIAGSSSIYMKDAMDELQYYNLIDTHVNASGVPQYDSIVACIKISTSSKKAIEASHAKCFPGGANSTVLNDAGCQIEQCYCECIF